MNPSAEVVSVSGVDYTIYIYNTYTWGYNLFSSVLYIDNHTNPETRSPETQYCKSN